MSKKELLKEFLGLLDSFGYNRTNLIMYSICIAIPIDITFEWRALSKFASREETIVTLVKTLVEINREEDIKHYLDCLKQNINQEE